MDVDLTELVGRARGGEGAAWDELVHRYRGLIFAIARSFRLSADDAADVVQLTWLRLFESIDRVREPERLAAWISTTARRECLRLLRAAGRELPTDDLDGRAAGDGTPAFAAPGQALIGALEREELGKAVQGLPDRHRRLLRLLLASTRPSYTAVAAAMDMPVGSIGPTRMRVIDRLRRDPHVMALAS